MCESGIVSLLPVATEPWSLPRRRRHRTRPVAMTRCSWWSRRPLALALLSLGHLLPTCFPPFLFSLSLPGSLRATTRRCMPPMTPATPAQAKTSDSSAVPFYSSQPKESDRGSVNRRRRPVLLRLRPSSSTHARVAVRPPLASPSTATVSG